MAGALGPLPTASGDEDKDYLFPDGSRFAALLNEAGFRRFNELLTARTDIDWVFLITDSREAFVEMAEQLPPTISPRQRVHLYRAYLDNFHINLAGPEA